MKKCNTDKAKHEMSATQIKCDMKRKRHDATREMCNMKRVQD